MITLYRKSVDSNAADEIDDGDIEDVKEGEHDDLITLHIQGMSEWDQDEQIESNKTRNKLKHCGHYYKHKITMQNRTYCEKCNQFLGLCLHTKKLCEQCFEQAWEEE